MSAFFGDAIWKLAPRLRMIANGSSIVNAIRAEGCGGLSVTQSPELTDLRSQRNPGTRPRQLQELSVAGSSRGSLVALPENVNVSVFVHRRDAGGDRGTVQGRAGLEILTIPLSKLPEAASNPDVLEIAIAQDIKEPKVRVTSAHAAPPANKERLVPHQDLHRSGDKGVLIGIVDVQGFDFSHPDFLDAEGKTRFHSIWDQGGSGRNAPPGFTYGAELTFTHLQAAVEAAKDPSIAVPAWELEPQSQQVAGSHGTHVASIAAGASGVCRKAHLAGVLVSLPAEDLDQRTSFYDSTRIAHAVEYLLGVGRELKVPVAINISLGTNGHAHDGSAPVNRWIEHALTAPGASVCVAAGNAGQDQPRDAMDWGYMMGRVHTSGRLAKTKDEKVIEWTVTGDGKADISENELELWYSPRDRMAVAIKPPGLPWSRTVAPGEYLENLQLADGSFLSIYNELYHPANGANTIAVYLSPLFSKEGVVGVRAGTWKVRLTGTEIRDGTYHGWIERDDPQPAGGSTGAELWMLPSYFSDASVVDDTTVNSLGCSPSVVTVANYDAGASVINMTSSEGPTRSGQPKPDLAAPGTDIRAAKGFAGSEDLWISMTGTSMASPYVTGVVGLMLTVNPMLTAAQIVGILRSTARPLSRRQRDWNTEAGYGLIDPSACIAEALLAKTRTDIKP